MMAIVTAERSTSYSREVHNSIGGFKMRRATKAGVITTILATGCLLWILALTPKASAIPAFSRKYQTSCATCHSNYPELNDFGEAFKSLSATPETLITPQNNRMLSLRQALHPGRIYLCRIRSRSSPRVASDKISLSGLTTTFPQPARAQMGDWATAT